MNIVMACKIPRKAVGLVYPVKLCYSGAQTKPEIRRKEASLAPGPETADEVGSDRKIRRMLPRSSESTEKKKKAESKP